MIPNREVIFTVKSRDQRTDQAIPGPVRGSLVKRANSRILLHLKPKAAPINRRPFFVSGKTGCSVRTNPNHIERMDQHQRTDIDHYGREWAARRLNFGRAVKGRRTVSFYWSVFIVIWRPNPYGVIPFWDDPWFVPIWKKKRFRQLDLENMNSRNSNKLFFLEGFHFSILCLTNTV